MILLFVIKVVYHLMRKFEKEAEDTDTEVSKVKKVMKWRSEL